MVFFYLHLLITQISEKVNVPEDQIRLMLSLLLSVPLGFIFRLIKNPMMREIYGVFFGLAFQYFVYAEGVISTLLQTVLTYVLIVGLKGKAAKLVFLENILFLSAHHIYRMYTDYGGWSMDITTMLMMFTCKYTSFAYSIEDGRKDVSKLSQDQNLRKIEKIPSFLEYFCYIYFFPGAIAGPSFEFSEYKDFIYLKNNYSDIPSSLFETFKTLTQSFIIMFLFVKFGNTFNIEFCGTEAFGETSYFYRFMYINISCTITRFRYYSGWGMAQSAVTSTGFSYSGKNENNKQIWDKVICADPFLELLYSPKEKIDKWNVSVQIWLKRYVYFRIYSEEEMKKSAAKSSFASNITFMISAFWHGFYPSYYIAFFHWSLVGNVSRYFYKLSVNYPKFPYNNPIYQILRFIIPNFFMNYYGIVFMNLFMGHVKLFLLNTWIVNVIMYVTVAFFVITGFGQKSKKVEKKIE